jgi:nucleoside 2-deoxyribosyltransferase
MKKAYCASPLGFSEAGRLFLYEKLHPAIVRAGFSVIDPWKLTPQEELSRVASITDHLQRADAWRALNLVIGRHNAHGIEDADLVVAVLDGSDADSGTASEIGYACAKGKPVIGYRSDFRLSGDNEGSIVNLQVEYFIRSSGGIIVSTTDGITSALSER